MTAPLTAELRSPASPDRTAGLEDVGDLLSVGDRATLTHALAAAALAEEEERPIHEQSVLGADGVLTRLDIKLSAEVTQAFKEIQGVLRVEVTG